MDRFVGKKYRLASSENFEEYLKFIGVGYISRKTVMAVTPTAFLTRNDDSTYNFTLSTAFKTTTVTFKPGEEFIEERADGVKVRSKIIFDGANMIQTQIEDNGNKSVHERQFTDDILTVISTADGWDGKCVRIYKLVE